MASNKTVWEFLNAAGLNMKDYLENPPTDEYNYIRTWTTNPELEVASPIYFIDKSTPPF
jgi:hypothetical protein